MRAVELRRSAPRSNLAISGVLQIWPFTGLCAVTSKRKATILTTCLETDVVCNFEAEVRGPVISNKSFFKSTIAGLRLSGCTASGNSIYYIACSLSAAHIVGHTALCRILKLHGMFDLGSLQSLTDRGLSSPCECRLQVSPSVDVHLVVSLVLLSCVCGHFCVCEAMLEKRHHITEDMLMSLAICIQGQAWSFNSAIP